MRITSRGKRERDVTLERSSAFAFRTTPSKSSPRGNNNRKRIEFSFLSFSFLKEEDQKRKKERRHESAFVSLRKCTFRALISSGGGKGGGRFVSDCLSEIFLSVFSPFVFRVYNPNCFCFPTISKSLRSEKAALEMTTNEGEDDDDIDFDEEEELLRRDVDRLLEEIAFLEETSSSSSLRNAELESRLETLEQNRLSIARRMTTMKKKKQSGNNNNDDDYGTTAFSSLFSNPRGRGIRRFGGEKHRFKSEEKRGKYLERVGCVSDGDKDAIETNTIRAKEVNEEKEKMEWIRKFGIENSMMMSGGKMDEEDLNAERTLRALK